MKLKSAANKRLRIKEIISIAAFLLMLFGNVQDRSPSAFIDNGDSFRWDSIAETEIQNKNEALKTAQRGPASEDKKREPSVPKKKIPKASHIN